MRDLVVVVNEGFNTSVLIHIHPSGLRPSGCIWINTSVLGIYLLLSLVTAMTGLSQVIKILQTINANKQ